MAVPFIPNSSASPQIVSCVWDTTTGRYVPVSGRRGQEIMNNVVVSLMKKEQATVVKHACGLYVPTDIRNQGLCGVLAIAVITGRTLEDTFKVMARKHKGNWKGGTSESEIKSTLKGFGKDFIEHGRPSSLINLERWTMYRAKLNKTYLVITTGHAQVIRNGYVMDQGGCRAVGLSKMKGKKVVNVLEIEE